MKFFLISAALVAVAVAVPILVQPGDTGPAPIDFDQSNPVYVGPAIVDSVNDQKPSLIQIVINVDSQGRVDIDNPIDVGPVIVDQVPEVIVAPQPAPVLVPEPVVPAPQPSPVIQEPEQLN